MSKADTIDYLGISTEKYFLSNFATCFYITIYDFLHFLQYVHKYEIPLI